MNNTLAAIHDVQLDMLRLCRDICQRHHLPYYLAQGTLLGAVRHKGFIPWDDDIDILMPAPALEKFREYFRAEAPEGYFCTDPASELHYPLTWTKIRRSGTTSMPADCRHIPIHWGISIDIFPLYEIGGSRFSHRTAWLRFKIAKKLLAVSLNPRSKSNRLLAKLPLKLRRSAALACLKSLERGRFPRGDYFTICKDSHVIRRAWIDGEETLLPFEGEDFRVPADSHAFLSEMFGDYMTPPPPEERRGHELRLGDIIWDTEGDYSIYQ